jgi:hypothetical protein
MCWRGIEIEAKEKKFQPKGAKTQSKKIGPLD